MDREAFRREMIELRLAHAVDRRHDEPDARARRSEVVVFSIFSDRVHGGLPTFHLLRLLPPSLAGEGGEGEATCAVLAASPSLSLPRKRGRGRKSRRLTAPAAPPAS